MRWRPSLIAPACLRNGLRGLALGIIAASALVIALCREAQSPEREPGGTLTAVKVLLYDLFYPGHDD